MTSFTKLDQEKMLEFKAKNQEGSMPIIGFGSAALKGEECIKSVETALQVGYRMIDSAVLYGNQKEVGEAIRNSGIPREDIWITSKVGFFPPNSKGVWMYNENNLKGNESTSIELSLQNLNVDYVDLMLLHNPTADKTEYSSAAMPHFFEFANMRGLDFAVRPSTLPDGELIRPILVEHKKRVLRENVNKDEAYRVRKESWKALEKAKKEGKCRFIGVSNYPAELLQEMLKYAEIMPAVNQVELHPALSHPQLRVVAKELGVALTGYGTGNSTKIEKYPEIEEIAKKHNKTYIQTILRWMLQLNVTSIPRSASLQHIQENLDIFDFHLSDKEMNVILGLNKNYPYYWDPESTLLTMN